MRISMWTSYLIDYTPREMVPVFAEHGWACLELSDEHGHDLLDAGPPEKVGEEFRRFAADHGVTFPQGHFYLATAGIRPDSRGRADRKVADIAPADDREYEKALDDMKRWVTLFQTLGIEAGVLHAGGQDLARAGWSEDRIFARRVDAVRRIAEFAKGGPTRICLENMADPGSGFQTVDDFRRLAEAVGMPNVGICLDTSHANVAKVDIPAFVRQAGNALLATHISDNLGRSDDHMLPYGRGTVPWADVVRALRDVDYRGLFNFEIPGENRCPMPIRLAKLDYARRLAELMLDES